ncbi:MAG: universal stress protein [Armatimonadetes bacterium]|nr:universal stress protein [Armatimonadota bacterium]
MFRKILLAYDGSEGAKRALEAAISIAALCKAELHSVSVEEGLPRYAATVGEVEEVKLQLNGALTKINEEAAALARERGVELRWRVVPGHEVEVIVTICKSENFDLLVIGFMGHSAIFGRIWGSTSQNLARLAPCSVLIVK